MDEGEKTNKLKSLENWNRELEEMHRQKADVTARVELHKKKIALMRANFQIILNNFEYLKPSWKYETVQEYIDNLKVLNLLAQEQNELDWAAQINMAERNISAIDEQIKGLSEHIVKVEKELSENGG